MLITLEENSSFLCEILWTDDSNFARGSTVNVLVCGNPTHYLQNKTRGTLANECMVQYIENPYWWIHFLRRTWKDYRNMYLLQNTWRLLKSDLKSCIIDMNARCNLTVMELLHIKRQMSVHIWSPNKSLDLVVWFTGHRFMDIYHGSYI